MTVWESRTWHLSLSSANQEPAVHDAHGCLLDSRKCLKRTSFIGVIQYQSAQNVQVGAAPVNFFKPFFKGQILRSGE